LECCNQNDTMADTPAERSRAFGCRSGRVRDDHPFRGVGPDLHGRPFAFTRETRRTRVTDIIRSRMPRFFRRLPAVGWPMFRPSRAMSSLGLATAVVLLALTIPSAVAQSTRRLPPGIAAAQAAINEGRYDEVASLTSQLDANDPAVVALRARALIARGQYAEAESALRPAAARAPASDAALELGLLLQTLGRSDARSVLSGVAARSRAAADAGQLARSARALYALDLVEDANAAFRDAAAVAPRDPAINTAWGQLFLDKQQNTEAVKSFQMALEEDPRHVPAMLGLARAVAGENPPAAIATARKILEVNASHVDTHVFLAGQAADAGRRDEARQLLQKALAVNPSSLDALAVLAAIAYVEDKIPEFDGLVAKVLAIAPGYADVYRVAGEYAAHAYRFDEAVTLVRRALDLAPRHQRALADLGVHLLRTGDEPGARRALDTSFELNPYDVVTFNLLQMMDTLETFVTVEDADVVLRLSKEDAPLLQEPAMALAKEALATLSQRYQFTPRRPILVEMFTKHDDFAVRNVGLPGMIGALGACFGRVVTLDSPRARPGEFQWEATLWHELAHVITLQMSNQRLPRWLSEGISEYEETVERPGRWGRGADVMFASLINREETIALKDLNAAFQNPQLIGIAYYQASLVVAHIVDRFGHDGLQRLVRVHAQGLGDEGGLKAALQVDFDDLQASFDKAMEARFGTLRAALAPPAGDLELQKLPVDALKPLASSNPGSYPAQMVLGSALRKSGDLDGALQAFERAAALVPTATGDDSPNMQIAQIALERKDTPRAIAALEALLRHDFDNVDVARELAKLLRESKITDPARLQPVYERITAVDPYDADAHAALGRLALARKDADTAVRAFRAVVALGPVDQAGAHTDLAESYLQSGRRADARKQVLAALEIAPSYQRAQDLLLAIAEGRP
jgi:tetratricopeptide (TPR) repeat protein